jgi:hypothetical protein
MLPRRAVALRPYAVELRKSEGRMVRLLGVLIGLGGAFAVSACAENNHLNTLYLDGFAASDPAPAQFTVCHGFGCSERTHAGLGQNEWRRVAAVFSPRAKTAQAERQQIARAVALVERMVGPQTGTDVPQWTHKQMLFLPNFGDKSQLDCVDEAVNTWTYTTMMERGGLLHFHRVAQLGAAGSFADLRNTAVVQEVGGGYYAIDASLVGGGEPPPIMPLAAWAGSWPPDLAKVAEPALPPSPKPAAVARR